MVVIDDSKIAISTIKSQTKYTFAQALRDKYVDQEEVDNRMVLPKDGKISTEITFVGFGTVSSVQKQLKRLTSIDLSNREVDSAGELEDLRGSLDRVQILNLADNFLSWKEIISIIPIVPNLRELILTRNHLIPDESTLLSCPFKKLTSLTMGRLYSDWTSLVGILSHIWCQIEQLDLWDNRLNNDNMELKEPYKFGCFTREIRILKLSHNLFLNMDWIRNVGPLDNLLELDLSKCQLDSINIDKNMAKQLENLRVLNIAYNNIADWKSISILDVLVNLRSLNCVENPIFISEKFAKSLTIGRLGKINILNREEITRNTRRDSEILYIRTAFLEYQSFKKGENKDFNSHHPRYEELAHYYGLPEDLIKKQVVDKYLTVELCLDEKKITKKLPCDMRIANVHMLCKRLFKLRPSSTIQITCCDPEASNSNIRYVLNKDGQTLHFFSVKNGQRLVIDKI